MCKRILNGLLIVSSLLGYLEWGGNNAVFLAEAEWQVFVSFFKHPTSLMHPLIIIPIIGQILLLIGLFQQKPKQLLAIIGIICIGLLLFLILFIGIIDTNLKIIVSVLPFWLLVILKFTLLKHK
ncbi:MAG: hypothetical protein ACOVNR_06345 [Chitinophagaceae bacterium]